jgi:hypothetical protein
LAPRTAPSQVDYVTVTKSASGEEGGEEREREAARCAWCGRRFVPSGGPGRPRRYCRRSCRQRDFEARRRVRVEGLAEHELVVSRQVLSRLDDLVYVLACALEDVQRDLAGPHDGEDVRRSLEWLMEAARPLAEISGRGGILT